MDATDDRLGAVVAMDANDHIGWFIGALGTAFGFLATSVATLFKISESKSATMLKDKTKEIAELKGRLNAHQARFEESDRRHDECQRDREALRVEMADIKAHLEFYIKTHGGDKPS